ncbi:VCBS repeat-containing protein [Flavihumibacter sp. R14]|nr:VCBS repeat-containing protein [Flavihumibacter soli]
MNSPASYILSRSSKGTSLIPAYFTCAILFAACNLNKADEGKNVFRKVDPEQSSISFSNNLTETDSLNILDYLYFYNGGGLGSADFNNDGLEDLYFVSNQESNRLYLNKGGLKFDDITHKSGTAGSATWKTGVTIVDINNDGFKDIYVSVVSGYKGFKGANQLFVNNGDLTFTDRAADYGLDFAGFATQASFFDYDKDGDLDMFLLTHSVHSNESYGDSTLRSRVSDPAGDHLFRNDNSHFTDVTKGSGIYASPIGYGLGISVADFNNDGWDDLYISNDFFEQDYYYVNQKNGTFREKVKNAFGHTSLFSMGNTAGDINKDGTLDLISTDMLPADIKPLKSTINDQPLDIYNMEVRSGFHYQNSKNTLQLNIANGQKFIDIGLYAGISATDWTWSPLIFDFNMDGNKDLFFSTGIKKRLNDLDYLKYLGSSPYMANGTDERKFDRSKIDKMPDGRVANFLYSGDSLLKFKDVSASNDMSEPGASSGAVYVDLDNDGDLDLVINNMDSPASVYENLSVKAKAEDKSTFLTYNVKFKGENIDGIGTKLFLRSASGKVDHQEIQTSTAFQSSQNNNLLFTFSRGDRPSQLLVIWPDNSYQVLDHFDPGKKQLVKWDGKAHPIETDISSVISAFLKNGQGNQTDKMDVKFIAALKVNTTPDFNYYSLLPHTYSRQTPPVAAADINLDGVDDLYVGGIEGEEKYLLIGAADGSFRKVAVDAFKAFLNTADSEAQWGDFDNDGDVDLLVTNAERPFVNFSKVQPQRLFINKGNLRFEASFLPALNSLTSRIALLDFNGDGFKDIFLAGAVYFRDYGRALPSFLMINKGNATFEKAGADVVGTMAGTRFIRDLSVSDLNKDGFDDLVIAAEWQPLQVYLGSSKALKKHDLPALENLRGWWQSVSVTDLNKDGKFDLLAGNWGLNNKYNVAEEQPLYAYNSDLDKDGKPDLILSYFYKGNHYPFRPKNDLEQELPYLKKEWLSYQKMADKTTTEIFKDRIKDNERLQANTFESIFISDILHGENITVLPYLYQQAPLIATSAGDKAEQLIINGNYWGCIPYEGKYDALGLASLEYDRKGNSFSKPRYWVNPNFAFNDVNTLLKIKTPKASRWILLTNEGKLLSVSMASKASLLAKTDLNKSGSKF